MLSRKSEKRSIILILSGGLLQLLQGVMKGLLEKAASLRQIQSVSCNL